MKSTTDTNLRNVKNLRDGNYSRIKLENSNLIHDYNFKRT